MLDHMFSPSSGVGYIGVIIILYTYLLTHSEKIDFKSYKYATLNIAGALLLLVSLYFQPNMPAIVIELAWLLISVYGLFKTWKKRQG
jgi:hypothetical protein